ncbi:nudC domain-containing protein 3 isoform X3 [Procambarus clarkii]|uniref:nudC domain-containing protein 3 isoform X3 n=1 Tax=Procambarus clarkii TaxID=6728 RepID=UPI001E673B4F|nr:nudC domain-containing protein 3-like isoform X1 [Procambarus clarkii]
MSATSEGGRHDAALADILLQEGNSLPAFLNAVFGFLSRRCPEEIYNSTHISGEHLISQSYCKWRQKYLDEKALQLLSQEQCYSEEDVPPTVAEEVVISQNRLNGGVTPEADDNLAPASGGTPAVRTPNFSGRKCGNNFDTTNGAVRDLYAWTQTVEDVEVRVTVPDNIMRGKQIHLEKSDECWWNRLLFCEDPIDMKKINAERDYATLPQEERQKIEELVWNQQQKDKGKPTTDQLKMESLLRVAWNAEGSPFQGKPYDPSLINFTDGGTFGNG